jgi:hypothetical protein
MKKYITILLIIVLSKTVLFAQEKTSFFTKYPFVNQTQVGLLIGREKNGYYPVYYGPIPTEGYYDNYTLNTVANVSLQTFNGLEVSNKTTLGITTGLDLYDFSLITPLAVGIRQIIKEKNKQGAKIQLSLDAGIGTTLFDENSSFQKTKGGTMLNPSLGFKFPTKNGSAWLVNFGYKYQYLKISQTQTDNYYISREETRNHKRFQFLVGFEF